MARYGQDYDEIRRRNQAFFPAVQFGQAPGMAEGAARMKEIANTSTYKSRREAGRMVASPGGGSKFVPFSQIQPYQDKAEIAAQVGAIQSGAYEKGFGQVSRPVLSDYSGYSPQQREPGWGYLAQNVSNFFSPQRGLQRLKGLGTFAANLFNRSSTPSPNRTQSQNFYTYNPSPVPYQPRRFDFNYF